MVRMLHPSGRSKWESGYAAARQRGRNLRTGLMLAGTMLGLFTFAVIYISLFH